MSSTKFMILSQNNSWFWCVHWYSQTFEACAFWCAIVARTCLPKSFFPLQSFCRTGFSHFTSPKPPQKSGEINWYPQKIELQIRGNILHPRILHTTIKESYAMISPEKSRTTSINTWHVSGKVGSIMILRCFFTRKRYFHKNPRISDIFPVQ